MTYYLIITDSQASVPVEYQYLWSDNYTVVTSFFDEYEQLSESADLHEYRAKSFVEFQEIVEQNHGGTINEYNELELMVSVLDSNIYHVTTQAIEEEKCEAGSAEWAYTTFRYGIIKAGINLSEISKYMKDKCFGDIINKVMAKYVMQYVLLDDGVITNHLMQDEPYMNKNMLDFMEINPQELYQHDDGIFSLVDYVMYTKMCDMGEL